MTEPRAPVPLVPGPGGRVTERLGGPRVPVDDALLGRLRGVCAAVAVVDAARAEAGRDWWPLSVRWAARGAVPALPAAVARPASAAEVAAVLAACNDARVPVTAAGGRSGVCGGSVPAFGGVALDLTGLSGITDVDTTSLLAEVLPGTFGCDLEASLRASGVTSGHSPQSMDLSTVGGWVACRGAGQASTRYGKIEDMVVGLEVALADGTLLRAGCSGPRAALGPDLAGLFVGSEGTLGIVTSVRLRVHPVPESTGRRAYGFPGFAHGLDALRRILRRGATPAVVRLYDPAESSWQFDVSDRCVLLVADEADPAVLAACLGVVDDEAVASGGELLDDGLVERWMAHRHDVSALAAAAEAGLVADTIEIAGRWTVLHDVYRACVAELGSLGGLVVASAHASHAYLDGACLYFTFAGRMPEDSPGAGDPAAEDGWAERFYTSAWQAVMDQVRASGAAISHHHGVGINRGRFMAGALGEGLSVLGSVKEALDPRGILNPGKLGLPSPFGEIGWP